MAVSGDTLINTLFDGRYRILRRLGAGGMANVYLAEDEELGRRVAVKILNERYANDDLFIERFNREAKSAASLSHPNIVSIYDRGEAEGTYYIAMEVVEGRSLKELILTRGPLSVPVAIAYTKQILAALRFAHRNGIIHRDIKPHNVLLGAEDRLKVTDFGIARAGASQMTEAGSIMGTAQYLSPEQARGAPVTAASDLYSVGVVLYEMLTGQTPFNGDSPIEIAMKHLNETPKPPSAIRRGLPRELDHVVLRALAKEPEDRYQSADELAADLDRVEAGLPVADETATAATAVLSGAAASAATQVLGPDARTRTLPAPPPRQPPRYPPGYEPYADRRRRRRSLIPWLVPLLIAVAAVAAGWILYTQFQEEIAQAEPVAVPFVEGMPEQQARERLDRAGFNVETRRGATTEFPPGIVFEQNPREGTRLAKGETVEIVVSTGPPKVTVPSVVGRQLARATEMLTDAGLRPRTTEVFSDKPVGEVLAQNPPGGAEVAEGTVVRLRISKGVETVEVPDVLNQSQESATAELENAGFAVDVVTVESNAEEGLVVDQEPNPGANGEKGSTVLIEVSEGPAVAQVPDVVGSDRNTARQTLRAAGFAVQVEEQETLDPAQDRIVIAQRPEGGTEAEPGTSVTIVVGRLVTP
jgi:beta-lactam-binding protein with PASTA domain/tRNA A-37 threonylcarbamoyl transferase component Bud32